jgi:hypothetical protein
MKENKVCSPLDPLERVPHLLTRYYISFFPISKIHRPRRLRHTTLACLVEHLVQDDA